MTTKNKEIPSKESLRKSLFLYIVSLSLLTIIMETTQFCGTYTLMPVCLPWMYYDFFMCCLCIAFFIIMEIILKVMSKRHTGRKKKQLGPSYYIWPFIAISAVIIIPALIILPNRFVSVNSSVTYHGTVIEREDQVCTLTKTAGSKFNYVKIKLNDNTTFWHNINQETKPLGTRCIIKAKTGIFGLRYVQDVDFIVE